MKKRKPPIRRRELETYKGTLYIKEEHPLIINQVIDNISLENQNDYRIILDSCTLNQVFFNDNTFSRTEFIDCRFKNCDFSNSTFTESTFIRCEFIECKFIGTHLVENYLNDILFADCNLTYLDLANNRFKILEVNKSNLKESNWFENKVDGMSFFEDNLSEAIVYNTPLKDVDISTSNIEGIQIDKYSLKGLKIASYQAEIFCNLLGIKIV